MLAARDIELIQEAVTELRGHGQAERARAVETVLAIALTAAASQRPSQADEYVTTGQAANLLGVSLATIRSRVAAGRLRGRRERGRVLVHRDSVRASLEALPLAHPADGEPTPEALQARRDWQARLLSGLPADKVARQEALLDKRRDGHALSRAELSELKALERELAAAAAEHLADMVGPTRNPAP